MLSNFLKWLFLEQCDHCADRKWNVKINRRKTFRGTVIRKICLECETEEKRKQMDVFKNLPINEDTRRNWF